MCGLLGLTINPQENQQRPWRVSTLLTQLMVANEKRGGDSYGLAIIPADGTPPTRWTRVGRISEHKTSTKQIRGWRRRMAQVEELCRGDVPFTVIGHNRKATHGDITERNQMPFVFGQQGSDRYVIGAHNGVISSHKEIAKELKIEDWHREVDSEVIFRGLQVEEDTRIMSLSAGGGSIASTWMRSDPTELHMFRSTNPLYVSFANGMFVWCSEETPLRYIMGDITTLTYIVEARKIHTVDVENCHIKDITERIEDERLAHPHALTPYSGYNYSLGKTRRNDTYEMNDGTVLYWDKKLHRWVDKGGKPVNPFLENTGTPKEDSAVSGRKESKVTNVIESRMWQEQCVICSESYKASRLVVDGNAMYCPWCAYVLYNCKSD